ncbi:MAG: hypothetical protein MPEBLZ_00898 [Candidatus Methanoperedens nitroreducens]|uniref:Uncharacterized protein n=1 Tax=Candidatus Methanoperedens nitratireducens TaxID=1392998 RepID=A0A0P8A8H3_9EURY|nr:hypothetical protein [Candidatus Methanoperedens sp. BLZ2]KAB2944351.1 MAG: hypothetical protein F9K14_14890 [Candidatus Methanoperedens sp.]KPQ44531.1 MAG: hypothetical protein MPEBLZ_00898 [Candidatus Methanoperedens sp. BLZ1]MBZ0175322.1 hypothetical protein [Candidatus Methanoperedens nitroreducens]CAG0975185.1 hypothetical protein METP2_01629 [Methanosarcinales archaeon]MCX9079465.1 hypothetical protein [Candidatus Methanoperedens sp.]
MPEQIILIALLIAIIFFSEVAIFGIAFIGFLVFFISEHAAIHSRRHIAREAGQHMDSTALSGAVLFSDALINLKRLYLI